MRSRGKLWRPCGSKRRIDAFRHLIVATCHWPMVALPYTGEIPVNTTYSYHYNYLHFTFLVVHMTSKVLKHFWRFFCKRPCESKARLKWTFLALHSESHFSTMSLGRLMNPSPAAMIWTMEEPQGIDGGGRRRAAPGLAGGQRAGARDAQAVLGRNSRVRKTGLISLATSGFCSPFSSLTSAARLL